MALTKRIISIVMALLGIAIAYFASQSGDDAYVPILVVGLGMVVVSTFLMVRQWPKIVVGFTLFFLGLGFTEKNMLAVLVGMAIVIVGIVRSLRPISKRRRGLIR